MRRGTGLSLVRRRGGTVPWLVERVRGLQLVHSVVLRGDKGRGGSLNSFYCSVLEGLEKIKTWSTIEGTGFFKRRRGHGYNEGGQKSPLKGVD